MAISLSGWVLGHIHWSDKAWKGEVPPVVLAVLTFCDVVIASLSVLMPDGRRQNQHHQHQNQEHQHNKALRHVVMACLLLLPYAVHASQLCQAVLVLLLTPSSPLVAGLVG